MVFTRCRSSVGVTPLPMNMTAVDEAKADRRLIGCGVCAKAEPTNHPAMTAVEEMRAGLRAAFPSHLSDGIDVMTDDVRMARAAPVAPKGSTRRKKSARREAS